MADLMGRCRGVVVPTSATLRVLSSCPERVGVIFSAGTAITTPLRICDQFQVLLDTATGLFVGFPVGGCVPLRIDGVAASHEFWVRGTTSDQVLGIVELFDFDGRLPPSVGGSIG